MNPVAHRATLVNIIFNAALFVLKLWVALISGSIALLSDAFNSLTDVASSVAVYFCVKVSNTEADEGHPFGHKRAEPIAGLIVAVLAGILGFEVLRASVGRIYAGADGVTIGVFALSVPIITVVVKGLMAWYFRVVGTEVRSPAILASSVDSLLDVIVAIAALIGIIGVKFGYGWLDPAAGIVISLWIFYTGYNVGMENIDYLMGKAPPAPLLSEIKTVADNVEGVLDTNTIRAHYVGHYVHVEIHIEVSKTLSTFDSHEIGEEVAAGIEGILIIDKAFVHIDPV